MSSSATIADRALALLAAFGLLVALAGFAGSAHWALDLVANFRPHGAVIAAVLLLLAAVRRAWIIAAISAITVLLQAITVLTPWPRVDARHAENELRVATINLHVDNQNTQALLDWVAQKNIQLLVVVELSPTVAARLTAAWQQRFAYSEVRALEGPFGLGVWSTTPLHQPTWSALGPFLLPSLAVALPDQGFTLLATHPFPPLGAAGSAARDLGLRELAQWRQQIAGDVLIVGDLNSAPWSHAFRELKTTASINAGSMQFLPWGTWSPAVWPQALGVPLDHVLLSGNGFAVLRREYGPDVGSDHRPLLLALAPIKR